MKKTNKGFSLVELIIVIAIMAILIGVLAPQYIKYVEKSRVSADEDTADALKNAAMTATTDEEYIDSINAGTITFTAGTVTNGCGTGMESALNEYFAKWTDAKIKSKSYKSKTYTVSIYTDANSNFKVQSSWN
jgi:type IV pilus assembly protein PilA